MRARADLQAMLSDRSWSAASSDRQVFALLWTVEWVDFVAFSAQPIVDDLHEVEAALRSSWWR